MNSAPAPDPAPRRPLTPPLGQQASSVGALEQGGTRTVARLLLVDAHDHSRRSSRVLLDSLPGLQVIGETGDHDEALDLAASVRPDVVVISMRVRGGSGAATTRALRGQNPLLPIVVLTLFDSPEYVEAALQAGALAYVLKQSPAEDLVAAIDSARHGRQHIGRGVPSPGRERT